MSSYSVNLSEIFAVSDSSDYPVTIGSWPVSLELLGGALAWFPTHFFTTITSGMSLVLTDTAASSDSISARSISKRILDALLGTDLANKSTPMIAMTDSSSLSDGGSRTSGKLGSDTIGSSDVISRVIYALRLDVSTVIDLFARRWVTTRHFTEMATYLTDGVSKDMFKKPYSDSYRLTDIDYYLNIFSYAAFGLQEYGGSLSNWPNNFYYVLTHKKPSGPRLPQRLIGRVISAIIKGQ